MATIPAVAAAHPDAAARLVARHGTEAPGVVALGGELDLLRPLVPGRPYLEAEVAWAVRHEFALSVDDVLSRRLRLSPELADRGASTAPRVAEIMGRELGWGAARCDLEVETYLATAATEYGIAPSSAPSET
jgi:glycerol-3-phosphate dehydrogenase